MANNEITKRLKLVNPGASVDADYGPYATTAAACLAVDSIIRAGRTVGIGTTTIVEYIWHPSDITDSGLVLKTASIDISSKADKTYVDTQDAAIISQIIGTADTPYNTLRKLEDKIIAINVLLNGDDVNLDQIKELADAIKSDEANITALTSAKVNITDVYNALDYVLAGKVLDARQGKVLKDLIDGLTTAVSGKQATLVSGTNIKTINSQSLLGSGDIIITGGGADTLGYYNVTDYGAIGNGVFDNTNAINDAINAASAAGGGIVDIPEGTWLIRCSYITAGAVYMPKGIIMKSNVILQGHGWGTIIKISAPPAGATFSGSAPTFTSNTSWFHMISGLGVSNAIIQNLTVDGDLVNQINTTLNPYTNPAIGISGGLSAETAGNVHTSAILFRDGADNRVINVKVLSTTGYGVAFRDSLRGLVTLCHISDAVNGGVEFCGQCQGGKTIHSYITKTYSDGIRIQSDFVEASYNEVSFTRPNSNAAQANFAGIYAEAVIAPKIIGNKLHDNSSFGIDVWDVDDATKKGAVITGNQIYRNRNAGIQIAMSNAIVTGNFVNDNCKDTAGIVDPIGYHQAGINVTAAVRGSLIADNLLDEGRGVQKYALEVHPSADRNTFKSNHSISAFGLWSAAPSATTNQITGNSYIAASVLYYDSGGVAINDSTPAGTTTYSSSKIEAKFYPLASVPTVTTGEKAVTVTPAGLQKIYDVVDPFSGTTSLAALDAATFTNNLTTLSGYAGEERLEGTNYIYRCISDNTWRRWLNSDLIVADLVVGTVSDSGAVKTSSQMAALYPSAIVSQVAYGTNGKYEYIGLSGWFYYANTITP